MKNKIGSNFGVTFPEFIVVTGILATLFGLISVNLLGALNKATLHTVTSTLFADLKSQQTKAMTFDTEGRITRDNYGVYFSQNYYILFHGNYDEGEPTNFRINLSDNIEINQITFPSSQIIFNAGSGEVVGFLEGQNSLTLTNTDSGEQKTIRLNRLGVLVGNE